MKRYLLSAAIAAAILSIGGCQNMAGMTSPVVGTWTARGGADDRPFTFGSVSFVGDRTFTAEAKYSGQSRVESGTWQTQGNKLMLDAGDAERSYTYKMEQGNLVVTEPKSGNSITFQKLRQ